MKDNRFYVDDVPLARNMTEWPPEVHLNDDGTPKPRPVKPKKPIDPRYVTGPIIERMRKRRGLTASDLSRKIGRAPSYIRALECKNESCRYETLATIARACGYKIIIVPEEKWREYEQAHNSWKTRQRP